MSNAAERQIGPFAGTFGIGSAVVGVLALLVGILAFVDVYMELDLFVPGEEPLLEGFVILTFGVGFAVLALFVGAYMEPGVGDDGH
ncbi:hypothetical protein OB905_02965 [Halobacteria archaeon AArc-dxtr1]|nr:hypothetical protein [Halobacteria archaeon AArc-dxtr1]